MARTSRLPWLAAAVVVCLVAAFLTPVALSQAAPAPTARAAYKTPTATKIIGRSVQGRAIVARRYGDPNATRVGVIIGSMHGTERAGFKIVDQAMRFGYARGTAMWVIKDLNPDGSRVKKRKNARGVDLNRNGSHIWKGTARAPDYYPGPRPMSEPETRAYVAFLRQVRPDVVVIYHQRGNGVDSNRQKRPALTRFLARGFGLPIKNFNCDGECTGTLTGWFNTTLPGVAITIELPASLSDSRARRFAIVNRAALGAVPDVK